MPTHYQNLLTIEASIDKPWYHGVLSQQEAEKRMAEMDMNTFLVRESVQDKGNLILSVKNGDKYYHFPIERGGRKVLQSCRKVFQRAVVGS